MIYFEQMLSRKFCDSKIGENLVSEDMPSSVDLDSYAASVQNIDTVIKLIAVLHVIAGILTIPIVYIVFSSSLYEAPANVAFMIIVMGSILALAVPI